MCLVADLLQDELVYADTLERLEHAAFFSTTCPVAPGTRTRTGSRFLQ